MCTHSRGCQQRTPIHGEYFHSGEATTLSFVVKGANAVGSFVMRSENSGNILCCLTTRHTTRHWQAHPRQHPEYRVPPQFQREDEYGMPPCYPRVLQCIRECNENQCRARILSKLAEEDSIHTSDVANSVVHNVGDARGNAPVLLLHD